MLSSENTNNPLTDTEKVQLATLLERAESSDIKGGIWYEMVKKFITVPIELCILDTESRVFLVYRKDREFDGYHLPGTVVNDWETVHDARLRLIQGEIKKDAGFDISYPESIGWLEVRRGNRPDCNPTRHTAALLHITHVKGDVVPTEGSGFYSFDDIPFNTLPDHVFMLRFFKRYLENGKPILGE